MRQAFAALCAVADTGRPWAVAPGVDPLRRENNRPSWHVNASASPSGSAAQTHRSGGNSRKNSNADRWTSRPSWSGSIRVSLGRPRAGPAPWRSLQSSHIGCGTAPDVVPMRVGPSFEKARRKFEPLEATSEVPRGARIHACRGARMRAESSLGAVRDNFNVLGATLVQPRRVRESRLSWACGCVLRLSREVA